MKPAFAVLFLAFVLSGCASTYSYSNKPLNSDIDNAAAGKASYKVSSDRGCYKNHDSKGDRCHEKTLVILALSGGGSRAAYFSASVMLELEKVFSEEGLNLLEEVDVISSVSGGSLPAAYYAVSRDRDDNSYRMTDRAWDEATVRKLMRKNYLGAWFRRWFWPQNIYRYWFTAYDRSDIMADVFADNLYDSKFPGFDYDFSRLQEDRPNLVLNATNGTMGARFGHTFSFTKEDFSKLGSDISRYRLADAVMASASFPAVFNYKTLRNFKAGSYEHVFDGGNADNLGLESVKEIIDENPKESGYQRVVVILVDSRAGYPGVSGDDYDARSGMGYAVDLNFLDSIDVMMERKMDDSISEMEKMLSGQYDKNKAVFYHLGFDNVKDTEKREKLKKIKTSFKILVDDTAEIDKAAKRLVNADNPCLQAIRNIVLHGDRQGAGSGGLKCTWEN